jgi:glycosyltransferase involved in cell wall biosynthesis
MKVVHINSSLNGGAGKAALRIHKSLIKKGVDSRLLHLDFIQDNVDENIYSENNRKKIKDAKEFSLLYRCKKIIKNRLKRHLGIEIINKKERIEAQYENISTELHCELASLPFSDNNILNHPVVQEADIIHFHWVSRMVDYPSFFTQNNKPLVWTLHDMNPFQGLFHYKGDEERNKLIASRIDNQVARFKRKFIKRRKSSLIFVTPSKWLQQVSGQSKTFANTKGYSIPNPINDSYFIFKKNTGLKIQMGIPENNLVFLFAANSVNEPRKGFDLLLDALNRIQSDNTTLLVLGKAENIQIENQDIRLLGNIHDDQKLLEYFSISDAFILPSREDNLPNVMLEAFSCGTPVIGFPIGGLKEHVIDWQTGLLSKEVSGESLAECIELFTINKHRFNSEEIKKYAIENFSEGVIAEKYINVYRQILSN